MSWFIEEYYNSILNLVRFQSKYEEGTRVKVLIVADTLAQAEHYARVRGLDLGSWKFVEGLSVLDEYPKAEVVCIKTELYREDVDRIHDYMFEKGRCMNYE